MRAAWPLVVAVLVTLCSVCIAGPTPVPIPRACSTPQTSTFPFCDPSLTIEQRVDNLISLLTAEEKPPLLTARESPKGNVSRLGLPEYDWGLNCVHGVQSRCGTKCPTSFACPNALGASFNVTNVLHMTQIMATEMRALWLEGIGENHENDLPHMGLDCWSPNININRDPRWGRNQEVPSEDPFWNGLYGATYAQGLQNGEDTRFLKGITTIKHWDAYSLDSYEGVTRHDFNAICSPYDLTNTYFPAFKRAVQEGNAAGFMCSYNEVNGIPSCANQFLNNTLRGKWGFDGYITSDSGAVANIYQTHHYVKTAEEATAAALHAGTDINSGTVYLTSIASSLQQGLITTSDVDLALRRTLGLRFRLGLFDPIEDQPYWHVPPTVVNTAESQAFNLFSTQQSMVLLKNDKNTLPFAKGQAVAVVGPHGNATRAMLGNYLGQVCPGGYQDFSCVTTPFQAIQQRNVGGTTTYAQGCAVTGTDTTGFAAALAAAAAADVVVLAVGLDQAVEGEGHDRVSISLPGVQEEFALKILALGKPTVVVLINGGIVAIDNLKAPAPAILEAFYPGYQGGHAIASVVFGDYNPGGKMPVTIYQSDIVNQLDMFSMSMTKAPGRSYRYFTGEPLWPFGYGLSYTTFTITQLHSSSQLRVSNADLRATVDTSFTVTNTGSVAGDEVVFNFMVPPHNASDPLIKQLVGFQRVHLAAGASTTVSFSTPLEALRVVDAAGDAYSEPGSYQLLASNGVDDPLRTIVDVVGDRVCVDTFK